MNNPAWLWVKNRLERMGYEAQINPQHKTILVNDKLTVRVKESKERTRTYTAKDGSINFYPWYQVNLSDISLNDEILVFVARDRNNIRHAYVIPTDEELPNSLALSSHPDNFTGKLSLYKDCWQTVGNMLAGVQNG